MLEWMRLKLKGIVIWGIISIITIVFLLGTGDYLFNRNSNNKIAATVNGQVISTDVIDSIYTEQIKQYHSTKKSYGNLNLDPQQIKNHIITQLVNQSAITTGLLHSNFIINDEYLIQTVKTNPQFQENGKFSPEKYNNFFKHAPFTELQYQKFLHEYLLVEQLHNSLSLSSFIPKNEIDNFITIWNQTRDFGFVTIPFKKFTNKPNTHQEINEQEIENYYNSNSESYVKHETCKIAYLDISTASFMEQIAVTQNELNKYYQEHINLYTLPELVNVRHILIPVPKEDSQDKSDAIAKVQIEDILTKLNSGQNFAKLAKQYSQDQGSAINGGDLGWIGKGETEPNFEQAAFSLNKSGDLSSIVKSKFGYHIIQLIDKRKSKIKSFEEILSQVTENYKEELAQTKLQNVIEEIENNSFEQEDLSHIASKFDLKVQFTGPFTSHGDPKNILSYNEIVIAAFDEKNLHKNSNLIKLANDRFIILRTIERQPAIKKTLSEAHDEIKQTLQVTKAKQKIQQQGLILAKELLNSPHPNKLVTSYGLEWNIINKATRDTKNINPEILKIAFTLKKPKAQQSFTLNNGDFVIIQLLNINHIEDKSTNQSVKQISEQLTMLQEQLEQQLYEKDLIDTAKIKIFKEKNYDSNP